MEALTRVHRVIVTHDVHAVCPLVDEVIVLEKGRLVQQVRLLTTADTQMQEGSLTAASRLRTQSWSSAGCLPTSGF